VNNVCPLRKRWCHSKSIKVINALLPLFLIFALLNCSEHPSDETARSGRMTLAVDHQLEDIAGSQADMFSRYYPKAHITLMPSNPKNTLKHLLDHSIRTAFIEGEPDTSEHSLFAKLKPSLRREPIAHDAIVCIVNSRSSTRRISLEELDALLSGREKNGRTPLLIADNDRLTSLFEAIIGQKRGSLQALICSSHAELITRVLSDNNAIGILFRSSLDRAISDMELNTEKVRHTITILPIARKPIGTPAYLPTQQNMFEGLYPLVTTVYYVYSSGDALATGFGAWLSSSGQKVFERSSFAPSRLAERTIILK